MATDLAPFRLASTSQHPSRWIAPRLQLLRGLCVAGLVGGALGSASCRRPAERSRQQATTTLDVPSGKRIEAWTFQELSRHDVALPSGCRLASLPMRYQHSGGDLVFTAVQGETGSLAAILIADDRSDPAARGIVPISSTSLRADVRDIPWLVTNTPPILAVSRGRWLGWLPQSEMYSPTVRLWLWREGTAPVFMAEGDGLNAVDSRCRSDQCSVLTTRPATVAVKGASLWQGVYDADPSQWKRTDVGSAGLPEGSRALGISRYEDNAHPVVVSFEGGGEVIFYSVSDDGEQQTGRVPIDDGVLDTAALSFPMAVTVMGKRDTAGCASESSVAVRIPGRDAIAFRTSSPAISAFVRPLTKGILVTWIAPATCRSPERKVVSAVMLDEQGFPRSGVMAVKHADGFAVSTCGDEVHLWLRDATGVTWVRANCG